MTPIRSNYVAELCLFEVEQHINDESDGTNGWWKDNGRDVAKLLLGEIERRDKKRKKKKK